MIRPRWVWLDVKEDTGAIEKSDPEVGQAIQFFPAAIHDLEKHCDIVVRVGPRITACA